MHTSMKPRLEVELHTVIGTSPYPGTSIITNCPGRKLKRSLSASSTIRKWNSFSSSVSRITLVMMALNTLATGLSRSRRL